MKISEVKSLTQTISNFVRDISTYESTLTQSAPDVWGYILTTLRMLSDTSEFLEASAGYTLSQNIMNYVPLFKANGIDLTKISSVPKWLITKDCDVIFPTDTSPAQTTTQNNCATTKCNHKTNT